MVGGSVNGFNKLNGKTYQEHIIKILELKGEIANKVIEAKAIIKKKNILFTHDMGESL